MLSYKLKHNSAVHLAVDPLVYKYSYISSYNFAHNKPLLFTDDDGKEISYSLSSDKNGSVPEMLF